MKKQFYMTLEIEVVEIQIEKGYADSFAADDAGADTWIDAASSADIGMME